MTLFGNNFNEGVKDRQKDGRDRPVKNAFRQLTKLDFWYPGYASRLEERLKGYNAASADVARVDNISELMPNIFKKLAPQDHSIQANASSNNRYTNINKSGKHMSIDELVEACTNLKNRLQSLYDDLVAIHQCCDINQCFCKEVQRGYSGAIGYLSEQPFIQDSWTKFEENQLETEQEIQKIIEQLDDCMLGITDLTKQIIDIDIVEIDRVIKWLETHPNR